MKELEKFIEIEKKRQKNINKIAESISGSFTSGAKTFEVKDSNNNKTQVTQSNHKGKEIFTVSENDKNTITVGSKKQLKELLGD